MKPNKNKKIIIIGIIVLTLLLVIGFVYSFVATDLMKSNKELFFKYASKMFDEEDGLFDKRLEQYNEKKKGTVYENYGNLSVNLNSENIDEKTIENVNNLNISFVGNTDNPNNKIEELVKINYSDDVNFSFIFKKIDDLYGVKLNKVVKQYLVVENDNLNKLFENIGATFTLPDKIDISTANSSNMKFNDEELKQLKEVYWKSLQDSFENSNFTKVSTSETDGYALEVDTKKAKEVFAKILEILKTDELMLNKLNKILGQDLKQTDIERLIQNVNSSKLEDGKAVITIHQSNGKLKKIEIQINDQAKIEISKSNNDDELSYNVGITATFGEQNINIKFDVKYTGLQNIEDVKENYNISIEIGNEESYSTTYKMENEIKFIDIVEITNFADKEAIILNDLEPERLKKVLEQVGNKIQEVNKEQMDKLGIKGDNPLIYMIPGLSQGFMIFDSNLDLVNRAVDVKNNTEETEKKELTSLKETEKTTFNMKFSKYEGDNVKGTDVKSLVMEVIANNMADEERQVEVIGDIKITGEEVPDTIQAYKNYKVKCEFDDDGYINEIEITEQQ